jgi:hypothetical protein
VDLIEMNSLRDPTGSVDRTLLFGLAWDGELARSQTVVYERSLFFELSCFRVSFFDRLTIISLCYIHFFTCLRSNPVNNLLRLQHVYTFTSLVCPFTLLCRHI